MHPLQSRIAPKAMKTPNYDTMQRRIKIRFATTDFICHRVSIRAAATGHYRATRCPQILARIFGFNDSEKVLRVVQPPAPLSGPARKAREAIDWRECDEQNGHCE